MIKPEAVKGAIELLMDLKELSKSEVTVRLTDGYDLVITYNRVVKDKILQTKRYYAPDLHSNALVADIERHAQEAAINLDTEMERSR